MWRHVTVRPSEIGEMQFALDEVEPAGSAQCGGRSPELRQLCGQVHARGLHRSGGGQDGVATDTRGDEVTYLEPKVDLGMAIDRSEAQFAVRAALQLHAEK